MPQLPAGIVADTGQPVNQELLPVAPRSQAYLIVNADAASLRPEGLASALVAQPVASVLLRAKQVAPDRLQSLIAAAQASGVAVLIEADAQLALSTGADGVHLLHDPDLAATERAFRQARAVLGDGRIVGASAGLVRHDAMILAELGADYVGLEAGAGADPARLVEQVAWWEQMFVVPCVAFTAANRLEAEQLAVAGADFVAAGPSSDLAQSLDILAVLTATLGAIA